MSWKDLFPKRYRYFETANGILYCGDCREVLPLLKDEICDALVTDPPFGIGQRYNHYKDKKCKPDEYWKWLKPIYKLMISKVKKGGFCAIWQTQKYMKFFWQWFEDEEIHIYAACKNFIQIKPTPIQYAYDPVIVFYKRGGPPLRPRSKRTLDFFIANTARTKSHIEKLHPCPRPVDQMLNMVDCFVLPGGIVLDPFCGSGTTSYACEVTGRKWIGIEIDPDYCELVKKRLETI